MHYGDGDDDLCSLGDALFRDVYDRRPVVPVVPVVYSEATNRRLSRLPTEQNYSEDVSQHWPQAERTQCWSRHSSVDSLPMQQSVILLGSTHESGSQRLESDR